MATNYELPEEVDEKCLECLGKELEMKTFKSNVPPELFESYRLVKIICVGNYIGYSCGETKSLFVDDFSQVSPPVKTRGYKPVIGCDFRFKTVRWQRSDKHEPITINLQFWELSESSWYSKHDYCLFKHTRGALVFWGTVNLSSLDGVPKWMTKIKPLCPSVPCVRITANRLHDPLLWIGPGKIFESEITLNQFCIDHGFVGHFEIKFRDWESGEKIVFGQAVNCHLENIFHEQE